jgi:hypothetical protein
MAMRSNVKSSAICVLIHVNEWIINECAGVHVSHNLGPFHTSSFGRIECNSHNR